MSTVLTVDLFKKPFFQFFSPEQNCQMQSTVHPLCKVPNVSRPAKFRGPSLGGLHHLLIEPDRKKHLTEV
jgi:hypothetical protein